MLEWWWTVSYGTVLYREEVTQLNIGFVGAGRAGTNLAKYFAESGLNISGFFIRKNASLQDFPFKLFTNLTLFIEECDVIFLTVQDDKINSSRICERC